MMVIDSKGLEYNKDNRGLLQKLMSFRYRKPNQIPIEGTVSNPTAAIFCHFLRQIYLIYV